MTASPTPRPDLAELRRLLGEATAGPWSAVDDQVFGASAETDGDADEDAADDLPLVAAFDLLLWREGMPKPCYADAALIVALRNAAPWLLDQAEAAERLTRGIEAMIELRRRWNRNEDRRDAAMVLHLIVNQAEALLAGEASEK